MQLTEVISVPAKSNEVICRNGTSKNELRKSNDSTKLAYDTRKSCENPAYSSKDEAVWDRLWRTIAFSDWTFAGFLYTTRRKSSSRNTFSSSTVNCLSHLPGLLLERQDVFFVGWFLFFMYGVRIKNVTEQTVTIFPDHFLLIMKETFYTINISVNNFSRRRIFFICL